MSPVRGTDNFAVPSLTGLAYRRLRVVDQPIHKGAALPDAGYCIYAIILPGVLQEGCNSTSIFRKICIFTVRAHRPVTGLYVC